MNVNEQVKQKASEAAKDAGSAVKNVSRIQIYSTSYTLVLAHSVAAGSVTHSRGPWPGLLPPKGESAPRR